MYFEYLPMDEVKKNGKLIVDFSNAKTTDEACLSYFDNLHINYPHIFPPDITDKIKTAFPRKDLFLESINSTENHFFDVMISEERSRHYIDKQLSMIGYSLDSYNPRTEILYLVRYGFEKAGLISGEADVSETADAPYPVHAGEIINEIGGELKPDTIENIKRLMKLGNKIEQLKKGIPTERLENIEYLYSLYIKIISLHEIISVIQSRYRSVLDEIAAGNSLRVISDFVYFLNKYNSISPEKLGFYDDNRVMATSPIKKARYVGIQAEEGWTNILWEDLIYHFVDFFRYWQSYKYLHKCTYCKKYFVSKTKRISKYCSDKCRLTYHNRKRIESGEHAKFKRERKNKGKATASYYG